LVPQQRRAVQRAFDHKADLPGMGGLAGLNGFLNVGQGLRGKRPADPRAVGQKMLAEALDAHILPTPRRTAAAKTATAAAESAAVA
jgi:hypothetical protein